MGRTVRPSYDKHERLASVARPDGRVSRAEHNAFGLPTLIVHPDGTAVRRTYDAQGNCTS